MKCGNCKGEKCVDCDRTICIHTGVNWGGLAWCSTDSVHLCRTCAKVRANNRMKDLSENRLERQLFSALAAMDEKQN